MKSSREETAGKVVKKRGRRPIRTLLKLVLGLLLLLILVIAVAPWVISSGPGTRYAQTWVNAALDGPELSLEKVSLGWGKGQGLRGLVYDDPAGGIRLELEELHAADLSLAQLLRMDLDFGRITLVRPVLEYTRVEPTPPQEGAPKPAEAPKTPEDKPGAETKVEAKVEAKEPLQLPASLAGVFEIVEGRAVVEMPGADPVEVTLDRVQVDIARLSDIGLDLGLDVVQGDVQGQLRANAKATDWFDADGRLQMDRGRLVADVTADRFALGSLEGLVGPAAAPIVPLLGRELDLAFSLRGGLEELTSTIQAKSEHLDFGIDCALDEAGLRLSEDSRLLLDVTPLAWDALVATTTEAGVANLQQPFRVSLAISEWNLPRSGEAWRWMDTATRIELSLGDILLKRPEDPSTYAVRSTLLSVETDRLAGGLKAKLGSLAQMDDAGGRVELDADVTDLLLADGALNSAGVQGRVKALVSDVPLAVVDQFLASETMLSDLIGPVLGLRVEADVAPGVAGGDLDGAVAFEVSAQRLSGQVAALIKDGMLTAPGRNNQLVMELTPRGIEGLGAYLARGEGSGDGAEVPVGFEGVHRVVLGLEELSIPLESDPTAAAGGESVARVRVTGLPFAAVDYLAGQEGRIAALLGAQLDEFLLGFRQQAGENQPALVDLQVRTPNLELAVAGTVLAEDRIELEPGAYAELALSPATLKTLLGEGEAPLELLEPAELRAEWSGMRLGLLAAGEDTEGAVDFARSLMDLTVTLPYFHGRLPGQGPTEIRDFAMRVVGQNLEQRIDASLKAHLRQGLVLPSPGITDDEESTHGIERRVDAVLDLTAELHELFGEKARLRAQGGLASVKGEDPNLLPISMELRDLQVGLTDGEQSPMVADASLYSIPVGLLDALAGKDGALVALLGGLIDEMSVKVTQASASSLMNATLALRSRNVNGSFAAEIRPGDRMEVRPGSFFELLLTPEAWEMWVPAEHAENGDVPIHPLTLEEPTSLRAEVRSLRIPLPAEVNEGEEPAPLDLREAGFDLALTNPEMVMRPHGGDLLHYRNLMVSLVGTDLSKVVRFQVKGEVDQKPDPEAAPKQAVTGGAQAAAVRNAPAQAVQARPVQAVPIGGADRAEQPSGLGGLLEAVLGRPNQGSSNDGVVQARPAPASAPVATATAVEPVDPQAAEVPQVMASTGLIHLDFELSNLLDSNGALQADQAVLRSVSAIRGLPLTTVDAAAGMDGQLVGILGPTASLALTGAVSAVSPGPMRLLMNSENALLEVATAEAPGAIRFQEDAVASLKLTPVLSQVLLKKVNPMLVNAIGSDQPVQFTIDSRTTQFPLGEELLQTAKMDARLELHSVTMGAGDILSGLLDALNRKQTESTVVTFMPMNLHLENGILSYTDAWMTVDNLAMVVEGQVDLVRDFMDLRLAISGETLALAFKELRDVVSETDVITVPLRGPIDKPRLDTGGLVGEVAKLAAKGALKKNLDEAVGGEAGAIIDAIFGGSRTSSQPPPSVKPKEPATQGDQTQVPAPAEEKPVEAKPVPQDPLRDLINILGGGK
ncbi:MAG: hypothetical protein ACOX52_22180 [Verrucomicrobiota bacterium]